MFLLQVPDKKHFERVGLKVVKNQYPNQMYRAHFFLQIGVDAQGFTIFST